MPISQERMTTLLLTIKHYKDSADILKATIDSYTQSNTDPRVLLVMLSELAASQKLPDNLYENYVQELAHFRARGSINLAKRRYLEKRRLLAETQPLSGRGVEGLKLDHERRAQARQEALAQSDRRQNITPPPPDTPREEIMSWERYYSVKYDWSQWTGPQAQDTPSGPADSAFTSKVDFDPTNPDLFNPEDDPDNEADYAAQEAFLALHPEYNKSNGPL